MSFVLFLLGQTESEVDAEGAHPSGMIRVTYVIAFAESALESISPSLPSDLVDQEVKKAHAQAEAAWSRMGLSFGVERYEETVDNLPAAASRVRRRSRSDRLLTDGGRTFVALPDRSEKLDEKLKTFSRNVPFH